MLAQHRLRAFAHHRSVPLFLNRPAAALVTAAAAVLTRLTSTALGKGGNIPTIRAHPAFSGCNAYSPIRNRIYGRMRTWSPSRSKHSKVLRPG